MSFFPVQSFCCLHHPDLMLMKMKYGGLSAEERLLDNIISLLISYFILLIVLRSFIPVQCYCCLYHPNGTVRLLDLKCFQCFHHSFSLPTQLHFFPQFIPFIRSRKDYFPFLSLYLSIKFYENIKIIQKSFLLNYLMPYF